MEGLFNVVPAEMDLLSLQEVCDVLVNRQSLVNLVYAWEFELSRNPLHCGWCVLPEDSDVRQRLYENRRSLIHQCSLASYSL